MWEIIKLIILSFGAILYLFIISKISGKKQISQLTFIDYVIGISLGSIAANMATDTSDTPWFYYIIGMTVFFFVDLVFSFLSRKGATFKHLIKGRPITLIYEGKIKYNNLKKSKLSVNDILCLSRELGYFDINEIEYAIFETNGNLSVLPKAPKKPVVIEDITKDYKETKLPNYLIIDGKISYSGLNEINKKEQWLYDSLKILDKKQLKNIILVSYDDKENKFEVHTKTQN